MSGSRDAECQPTGRGSSSEAKDTPRTFSSGSQIRHLCSEVLAHDSSSKIVVRYRDSNDPIVSSHLSKEAGSLSKVFGKELAEALATRRGRKRAENVKGKPKMRKTSKSETRRTYIRLAICLGLGKGPRTPDVWTGIDRRMSTCAEKGSFSRSSSRREPRVIGSRARKGVMEWSIWSNWNGRRD